MAQLVARFVRNEEVGGSNPPRSTPVAPRANAFFRHEGSKKVASKPARRHPLTPRDELRRVLIQVRVKLQDAVVVAAGIAPTIGVVGQHPHCADGGDDYVAKAAVLS